MASGRSHDIPGGADEQGVADADAEQQAVLLGAAQAGTPRAHVSRRVHPDVEDAGGDHHGGRERQHVVERPEQVAADIGHPQRGEPEGLQLGSEVGDLGGIAVAQLVRPDTGSGERSGRARPPTLCSGPRREPGVDRDPPASIVALDDTCGDEGPELIRRMRAKDLDGTLALIADDAVYFWSDGAAMFGKAAIAEGLRANFLGVENDTYDVSDLVWGPAAVRGRGGLRVPVPAGRARWTVNSSRAVTWARPSCAESARSGRSCMRT